jgi:hypothetical protein
MTQPDHHVLVAGAGPAGLITAATAARHGDRRPASAPLPRRRRGAPHDADGRYRDEHRRARAPQPRLADRLGDALLDGYEAERRPVGRENVRRSLGRGGPPGSTGSLEHDLGGGYRGPHPGGPGRPGAHVPVLHDGRSISTLDLFDGRLTW